MARRIAAAVAVVSLVAAGCGVGSGSDQGSAPPSGSLSPAANKGKPGGTGGGGGGAGGLIVTAGPNFDDGQGNPRSRVLHTATLLNDGRVLIVGGVGPDPAGAGIDIDVEFFDETSNGITSVLASASSAQALQNGMMTTPGQMDIGQGTILPFVLVGRYGHTATKLTNGMVAIIAGAGFDRTDAQFQPISETLKSMHVFDPASGQFALVPARLAKERYLHNAIDLGNDRVLVIGGLDDAGTEVKTAEVIDFSPARTGNVAGVTVQPAGTGPWGLSMAAQGLVGGKPVQWGGIRFDQGNLDLPLNGNNIVPGLKIDPVGTITQFGSLTPGGTPGTDPWGISPGYAQVGGKLWVAGALTLDAQGNFVPGQNAWLVDDLQGNVTNVGALREPRGFSTAATYRPQTGGEVIIAGGHDGSGLANGQPSVYANVAELWSAGRFAGSGTMIQPRAGGIALSLRSGKVAHVGGAVDATSFLNFDGSPTETIEIYSR